MVATATTDKDLSKGVPVGSESDVVGLDGGDWDGGIASGVADEHGVVWDQIMLGL